MEYNFISKLSGTTALHDASKYGKAVIARLLIDKGADVHVKDRAGFTPLHVSESQMYQNILHVNNVTHVIVY